MNIYKRNKYLECVFSLIFYLLFASTSCERNMFFKNCTNDTLFIGASHFDNLDSVERIVFPIYSTSNSGYDTLWKSDNFCFDSRDIVYPDSICGIDYYYLFENTDTCFFFLIKCQDANRYSWKEIRDLEKYYKWVVGRNKDGEFDTKILYSN